MTNTLTTPLVLVRSDKVPREAIQSLLDELEQAGSPATELEQPEPGPFACAEWYIPTAAALWIAKPYFETILKRTAEDHYPHIKRAVGSIWQNFFGDAPLVPRLRIFSSPPKKASSNYEFSLTFSVVGQGVDRERFKLLLPNSWSRQELERATEIFIAFVAAYHAAEISRDDLEQLRAATIGNVVALTVDQDTGRIRFLNPIPSAPSTTSS